MSAQAQKLKFLEDEPSLFGNEPLVRAVTVAKPAAAAMAPVTRAPVARTPIARTKAIEKSATAHRTISEVAEELDVPQHVLRFWETKFAQLRPLKRAGGRRYYRTEDVVLIKHIHSLLYAQGYTIKGAQKVLKDKTARPVDKPVEAVVKAAPKIIAAKDDAYQELRAMLAELKALRALV